MKDKLQKNLVFLIGILAVGLYLAPLIRNIQTNLSILEGFSGLYDLLTPGTFPKSVDNAILNSYPQIGKNKRSNNSYNDIWFKYPMFPLASFEQITNNLRYRDNPDEGTCIRADFCGAIYNNKKNVQTNIITPLPPVEEGSGARVGYFRSEPNELYFSIPNNENILY